MWLFILAVYFSEGYACIATESPDDRPTIPGVFTTTVPGAVATTTIINTIPITTATPTTTASTTSTTTSTTTTTTTSTTTTTIPACPTGYTLYMDAMSMETSCYYVSPFDAALAPRISWAAARSECMAADLANMGVPTTPPPNVLVEQVWLGGSCATNCRFDTPNYMQNWLYLDGTPIDPLWVPWVQDPGFPQPDWPIGSCLSLLTNNNLFPPIPTGGVGKWHDLECSSPGRYACEISPWPPAG